MMEELLKQLEKIREICKPENLIKTLNKIVERCPVFKSNKK